MPGNDPSDADRTDRFVKEDVERRRAPRGVFPGLQARIVGGAGTGRTLDVLDAGEKSLFLACDPPEALATGAQIEVELVGGEYCVRCTLHVARHEHSPRRGVAVTITDVDPADDDSFAALLGIGGE